MTAQYYLTRDDLAALLNPVSRDFHVSTDRTTQKRPFLTWTGLLGTALVLATLNLPTIWQLSRQSAPLPAIAPALAASSALTFADAPASEAATPAATTPQPAADRLAITDLSIDAPVIWNSAYDSKTLLANLRDGLVHLKGTALPGQKGLTIVTGHSSYYRWAAGSYKDAFAPLLKAQLGQKIKISRAGTTYTYEITQIYEVTPDRTDLLVSGNETMLRLITCTPLGSNTRRLIVEAKQIDPDPNQNQAFTGPKLTASTLTSTR